MKTLLLLLGVAFHILGAAEDDIVSQLKRRDLTGDAAHLPAVSTPSPATTTTWSSSPKPSPSPSAAEVKVNVQLPPSTTTLPPQAHFSSSPANPSTAESIVIKAEVPTLTTTPTPFSSSIAPVMPASTALISKSEHEKAPGLTASDLEPLKMGSAAPIKEVAGELLVSTTIAPTLPPSMSLSKVAMSPPAANPTIAGNQLDVKKASVTNTATEEPVPYRTASTTLTAPDLSTSSGPVALVQSSEVTAAKPKSDQSQVVLPASMSVGPSSIHIAPSTPTPPVTTTSSSPPPQIVESFAPLSPPAVPPISGMAYDGSSPSVVESPTVMRNLPGVSMDSEAGGGKKQDEAESIEWMAIEGYVAPQAISGEGDKNIIPAEKASVVQTADMERTEQVIPQIPNHDAVYGAEWELPPSFHESAAMSSDTFGGPSVRILEANAANYSIEQGKSNSYFGSAQEGLKYPKTSYDGMEALNTMMEYIQWKGSLGQTIYYHPAARSLAHRILGAPIWAQIYALDLGMANEIIANADAYAYSAFYKLMENFSWVLIILLATQVWSLSRRTKVMGERLVEAMRHQREENEKHAKNIMKYVEAHVKATDAQRQAGPQIAPSGDSPALPGPNQRQWGPGAAFAPYTPDLNTCVQDLRLELENLRNQLLSELHVLKLGIEATFISQQEALVRSATIQDTFLKFYTSFTTFMVILTQECEGVLAVNENFQQVLCEEGVKMSQTLASKEFVRFLDIIDAERVGFGLLKASSPLFEDMRSVEAIRSFLEYLTASDYDDQVSTYGRSPGVPSEDVASPQGMTYSEPLTPPPGTHGETLHQV